MVYAFGTSSSNRDPLTCVFSKRYRDRRNQCSKSKRTEAWKGKDRRGGVYANRESRRYQQSDTGLKGSKGAACAVPATGPGREIGGRARGGGGVKFAGCPARDGTSLDRKGNFYAFRGRLACTVSV